MGDETIIIVAGQAGIIGCIPSEILIRAREINRLANK